LVAAEWDTGGAVVFELDVEAVIAAAPGTIAYSGVSAQPAVLQDLAVVVPNTTAAGDLVDVARKAGGKELESVEVFDVYSGEQVGIGNVSIGLRLAFRVADRTLTEEEASVIRNRILAAITEHAGGQARA
jgi:phenylalanyl-tRNA synthetase beta chain